MLRPAPRLARVLWVVACLPACGPGRSGGSGGASEPVRPTAPLTLDDARRYALALVNRDRATEGLPEVELDEIASAAAQRHAEDLASHGVTAHHGTDGSVPEQRYAEAGGEDLATENAACFFDGVVRPLDPDPRFRPEGIETIETAF
ncbi:MAG: CAP domain-containing protein, partial [Deltaproteobacteria bacterium]|nr:CAP domain-containing protein [Deltaproteobacteria bacterium]